MKVVWMIQRGWDGWSVESARRLADDGSGDWSRRAIPDLIIAMSWSSCSPCSWI